ncbi:iron-containing redox enzyme family protein [Nocardioides caldifontis]|uniref:iron-containing redox enzyme family protein n=1 Tax=Nocardioides caldifontis TaxID=2588938 RepID=UPI0011DF1F76|nr:iron-containing redox enzyme family protein [Nocardioides caldifontis]
MYLPHARGPLSTALVAVLGGRDLLDETALVREVELIPDDVDLLTDEDVQLTLWVLYELHYRGFEGVDDDWEWDPGLLQVRRALEDRLLAQLRFATAPWVQEALGAKGDVASRLFALTESVPGAPLSSYMQREATEEEFREYLVHKSVYHLKESDPQSFVLPRLQGRAKVALAELQYDEYGAGRPDQLHQALFAGGLDALGLSSEYGTYVDRVPAPTLAVTNVMNLFALRRSLAAASMGHLGAFEATSSEPCRKVAGGCRRLGLPDAVSVYFDEHVEADAVHEQLAFRDICGTMAAARPELVEDLFFGAAAYLVSESVAGQTMLDAWAEGRTSLREEPQPAVEERELETAVAS